MTQPRPTANDRFKQGSASRTWGAIASAALIHFAVLALWPAATPEDLSATKPPEIVVSAPPEIPIPPPPDVARPKAPVISVDAPTDVTIPPTVGLRAPTLAPPALREETEEIEPGGYVAHTVEPELLDRDDLVRQLRRRYPARLRDAGIEGTALLWVYVSEEGRVKDARIKESSGRKAFDEIALEMARSMAFRPALNLDQKVAVWVQLPVAFQIR